MQTPVRWLYVVAGVLSLVSWGAAVSAGRPVIASFLWGVGWMCFGLSVGVVDFHALTRKPGQ